MLDNQGLLHSVFLLYAEASQDGALIDLPRFRLICHAASHRASR